MIQDDFQEEWAHVSQQKSTALNLNTYIELMCIQGSFVPLNDGSFNKRA
jgi:hypothetical protein